MMGWNILLWAWVESTTLKSAPSLRLRSTGLYFLGSYYAGYRWGIEFSVPLPTLLQLQSCLVPCISARIFIIPKLQNILCKWFLSELFSLCVEHLPNCYSVRPTISLSGIVGTSDRCFREHLFHALPTERILNRLRSIPSQHLIFDYSSEMVDMLEIIVKWLQVSC